MKKYRLKDIRDTMGQSEEIYHAPEIDKEIERLRKELDDALVKSCKYFDCSYREALKEE